MVYKNRGRKPLLTTEQKLIIAGWILAQNEKVDYEGTIHWIHENFDVEVSKPILCSYLKELELSFNLLVVKQLILQALRLLSRLLGLSITTPHAKIL
jgi:trehalose-6-phosphatase